ncbi:MAG: gfo/Idh/MocA family oxidoreductase [Desulfobacteraceae bacterium]|nr:MAG: gfo/Idh/MocA family oxidoreductase [Desulfobacteraceae bacterium]
MTIRLGIIGCGRVAQERHLPALQQISDIQVTAVADVDKTRLNKLADQYKIQKRYHDYRYLLDLPDIDAVGVLTPTGSHLEIGLATLDAGKHMLLEKPLALNLAECDQLIAKSKESASCKVVVGFNNRWHRLVQQAGEFIQTGALGTIKAVNSVYTHSRSGDNAPDWHRKLSIGGGVSFNEAVHHFDLWHYLTGSRVEEIFSFSNDSSYYEDETHVTTARLSGGILATGIFTFKTSPTSEMEIYGDLGRLHLSLYKFDGLEFFPHTAYPGDIVDRLKKMVGTIGKLPQAIPNMRRGGDFTATFHGLWNHFVQCVTTDLPSECTPEDGKRALKVSLGAVKSIGTGQPVRLSNMDS